MTKEEAQEFVANTFDDDDSPAREDLESAFMALYERPADSNDRDNGLWSLICSAVSHCPCSTRAEHERGACRHKELSALLTAAIESGSYIAASEWDDLDTESGWDAETLTVQAIMDSPLIYDYEQDGDDFFARDYDGRRLVARQIDGDVATMAY